MSVFQRTILVEHLQEASCYIKGQDFECGKTVFIVYSRIMRKESRKSASELYQDMALLSQFCLFDLLNIVSTAIFEETMKDITLGAVNE